jgi:hypothetical protein
MGGKTMSIYSLTQDFLAVQSQLEERDLDAKTVADTLETLQIPIEDKAENIIKWAKNLQAMSEVRKNEAKRLTELASKDEKKAERLLGYLDEALKLINKKNLTAGVFEVWYRKGSEVIEIDPLRLPQEYWIIPEPKPQPFDKPKLKKLVKSGVNIPGVSLVRKEDTLQIK